MPAMLGTTSGIDSRAPMVVSGDDGWTAGVALELIYKILRKFNICMAINVNELRNCIQQADT